MNNIIKNSLYLNKAFCIAIKADEKCHEDLGDPEKTYDENGYLTFLRGDQLYFTPEADKFGGNRKMDRAKWKALETIFGEENVITVEELKGGDIDASEER